jgi:cell division cycle protein 37
MQDHERVVELKARLVSEADDGDREAITEEIKDLEGAVAKRADRLADMEKNKKWNVDNMCHVVEERTVIGKEKDTLTTSELPPGLAAVQASKAAGGGTSSPRAPAANVVGPASEGSAVQSYSDFVDSHEALLEEYVATDSMDATQKILHEHGDILLQENATSYLLLSCLEEEMNGFHAKMK